MSLKDKITGFFKIKAVKTAAVWLLVIAVGVTVLLTQFMYPVHPIYEGISIASLDGTEFDIKIKNNYKKIKDGNADKYSVILSDTEFDFSKPQNFRRVELKFNFINIGMYKISDIQFNFDSIPKYSEAFVFKETNLSGIDRFNSSYISLFFVICTEGLTQEQVNEAINALEISYSFNRPELFASGGKIELPVIG